MQERFHVFLYKVIVWLFLGGVIGSFVALMQGFMPLWFIFVLVFGSIALGAVFVGIFVVYTERRVSRVAAQSQRYGQDRGMPARIGVLTKPLSFVLIFSFFSLGFLLPYLVTGNLDWFRLRVKYFPQKLLFQYKGNFNPEVFKKAYDKAIMYIGDRRIESLLFYKDFTELRIERLDKPGYFSNVTIRGNSVSAAFMTSRPDKEDRLFTVDSIRYELLKGALEDAATDHGIEDMMYIGVRKGIRWGTRDGRIPPDYERDHIDIHLTFSSLLSPASSLHYNGETGQRLPR